MQVQCKIIEEHQLCEEETVQSVAIEESSNSSRFTDTYTASYLYMHPGHS